MNKLLEKLIENNTSYIIKKFPTSYDTNAVYKIVGADRRDYITHMENVYTYGVYPVIDSLEYMKQYKVGELLKGEQLTLL